MSVPQRKVQLRRESTGLLNRLIKKVDGCDIEFKFKSKAEEQRVLIEDPREKVSDALHNYTENEVVEGVVEIKPKGQIKHNGIIIEFVGCVHVMGTKERTVNFLREEIPCQAEPVFSNNLTFEFRFANKKSYESFRGNTVRVYYYLRVIIHRQMKDIKAKEEIWVTHFSPNQTPVSDPTTKSYMRVITFGKNSVCIDVGVESLLHIEFKYEKAVYHLQECIMGQVNFKTADLDLHYGEIGIVRKEILAPGTAQEEVEVETLQKLEIMDGTPIAHEIVPIRIFLNSIRRLTPTYANIHNVCRVAYFLNLVLVTSEGKRFFKQQEITLYRQEGQSFPKLAESNI